MSEAWAKTNEFKEHKKWKPFHATNLGSLMYPCFFVGGIFGTFPYKCVSSRYSFSRIRVVYSTFLLIIFIGLLISVEYRLITSTSAANNIPTILHQHFYFIVFISIMLLSYFQSRAILHLIQAITNISSMLAPKDFDDLAKFIHTKDIGMFLFLICHVPHCVSNDLRAMLKNFSFLYAIISSNVMEMFYINCVCVLKACFSKLNEDLYQLKKPTTQKFLRNGQSTPSLLIKLKNFEERHLSISDVLQLLNRLFFIRLIITTCITFISVTFNLYLFILWQKGGQIEVRYLSFWYIPYIITATYYFCKFTMIIWACETASNRAAQIRITLYNVLGEVSDLTMKREVELFSLQLLHLENRFSAKMIKLNASLLAQIVGGIAMYILIMIQFLLNTVVCRFKNVET